MKNTGVCEQNNEKCQRTLGFYHAQSDPKPFSFVPAGAIGLLWSILWFFLMSNSPESHSRISPAEKAYIVSTRADVTAQKKKVTHSSLS